MLVLASKSPRRQELLCRITEEFEVCATDADETLPLDITPWDAVLYLSKIKAEPLRNPKDIIIGADTVVALDGEILGKPKDKADAKHMLKMLSGQKHSVFTGVTVFFGEKREVSFYEETKVCFYDLSDDEIDSYIDTGEPMDKAGAYGIQGYGALLVKKIAGDYFNVVGLPIGKLNRILLTDNV